jgi:hypothetical protein
MPPLEIHKFRSAVLLYIFVMNALNEIARSGVSGTKTNKNQHYSQVHLYRFWIA